MPSCLITSVQGFQKMTLVNNIAQLKKCAKCKVEKPFSAFSKNKNKKLGIDPRCKECVKEYNHKNKHRIKEKNREYYNKKREIIIIKVREYRKSNKEVLSERYKNYRKLNVTLIRQKDRERYRLNKNKRLAFNKIWFKKTKNQYQKRCLSTGE
jgi:primase-polymerase (primpol)-like protein